MTPFSDRRTIFKQNIENDGVLLPGAFNALTAKMLAKKGFKGMYISGAALSASAGFPDIGILTLTEFLTFASYIVRATDLPCICDADTGFGERSQVIRTVQEFEQLGLAGLHIEDQLMPKRCGHLKGKTLIPQDEMCEKIKAAVQTRQDPNFLIIARTDARSIEGLESVITRSQAYIDSGADMVFPEALQSREEFEWVAASLHVPLLANMTEFGVSPLIPFPELKQMGYKVVIYPVSSLRIAMKACDQFFDILLKQSGQEAQLGLMQTRQELYDLLGYTYTW